MNCADINNTGDTALKKDENAVIARLLAQIRENGKDANRAFTLLIRQFFPLIETSVQCFYNYSWFNDHRDDLQQSAVYALWCSVWKYDETKGVTFGAYAKAAVKNALVDACKRQVKEHENMVQVEEDNTWVQILDGLLSDDLESDNMSEEADMEALSVLIATIDKTVKGFEKEVLWLSVKGKTIQEIAEIEHCDKKKVNNALYQARLKLKKVLKR